MRIDSFAGMFDQNADQWARQEPMILSDFTARPLVLQELAPVTGKHVLDLGCGTGRTASALDARDLRSFECLVGMAQAVADLAESHFEREPTWTP
jgi:predicted TPR repeat methyltransferase